MNPQTPLTPDTMTPREALLDRFWTVARGYGHRDGGTVIPPALRRPEREVPGVRLQITETQAQAA